MARGYNRQRLDPHATFAIAQPVPPSRSARRNPPSTRALWARRSLRAGDHCGCEPTPTPAAAAGRRPALIVAVRPGSDVVVSRCRTARPPDSITISSPASPRNASSTLVVVEVDSAATLMARSRPATCRSALAASIRRRRRSGTADAASADPRPVLWTNGYYAVEPVLIYGSDGFKPKTWKDLEGADGRVCRGHRDRSSNWRPCGPRTARSDGRPCRCASADALIARVSEGDVDFAVVPSIDAAAARNVFLEFDVAFTVGPKRDLAWAVAPAHRALRDDLDRFFTKARAERPADAARRSLLRSRAPGPADRRGRFPGTPEVRAAGLSRGVRARADRHRRRVAPAWRRSPTRNRNGIRSRRAKPACAGSCRSPKKRRSTWASRIAWTPRRARSARRATSRR